MYTIPTDDVLKFLSSDFMPIVLPANATLELLLYWCCCCWCCDVALIENAGANLPASQTLYTAIKGDGTGGKVKFVTNGSGTITSAEIEARWIRLHLW